MIRAALNKIFGNASEEPANNVVAPAGAALEQDPVDVWSQRVMV